MAEAPIKYYVTYDAADSNRITGVYSDDENTTGVPAEAVEIFTEVKAQLDVHKYGFGYFTFNPAAGSVAEDADAVEVVETGEEKARIKADIDTLMDSKIKNTIGLGFGGESMGVLDAIWSSLRQPVNPDVVRARNVVQFRDAKIQAMSGMTLAELRGYNPSDDAGWPE